MCLSRARKSLRMQFILELIEEDYKNCAHEKKTKEQNCAYTINMMAVHCIVGWSKNVL